MRSLVTPRTAPYVFLSPFLILFATFVAWPLVSSLILAMQQSFGPKLNVWVGPKNFLFLLEDPLFWKALTNTAIYASASLIVQLPLALGLAMLLNHPALKGRAFYRLLFFSPSLVGMVFVAILFGLIFEKRSGLLNRVLHDLIGFNLDFPWLETYVMPSLILASLWMYVGYNMIFFLAALQNVDRDLVDAASVDGAGVWSRFWHITLPSIRPIAGFVVLLSLIGSFQLFELPYLIFRGGGPGQQGLTVVMYLYQNGFEVGDLGYASAIGWALALILIAATLLQRRLSRGEAL